jgi:hypothetical protein
MRLFKSRRAGWSGNEGDKIMYKILNTKSEGKNHLGDQGERE